METARTLTDVKGIGLQLPDAAWSVSADDWFLGEDFNLLQYSVADGYFKPVGALIKADGKTEEITPPSADQQVASGSNRVARASGSVTISRPSRVTKKCRLRTCSSSRGSKRFRYTTRR